MNEVLLITPLFPPEGGGATRRVCAYAKYLPRFGWKPIVLTPFRKEFNFPDYGLLNERDPSFQIVRAPFFDLKSVVHGVEKFLPWSPPLSSPEKMSSYIHPHKTNLYPWLRRWLLMPDELITWMPAALKYGKEILSCQKVKAILSVGPSHSAHLLASRLRRCTNLPWIADFKDPWTTNPFVQYVSRFHKLINRLMERRVLHSCSLALTVSDRIANDLKGINPSLCVEVLPNGFDPEEFCCAKDLRTPGLPLRVIHAGALYGERTPVPFLKALHLLRQQGITAEQIQATFLGANEKATREMVEASGVNDLVQICSHVSHDAALEMMNRNDVCLLLPGPGKGTITGKVFEYLALKRPVLCVGGQGGDLERLLLELGASQPFPETDTEGIANQMLQWVKIKREGLLIRSKVKDEELSRYDRREQVESLACLLEQLAATGEVKTGSLLPL